VEERFTRLIDSHHEPVGSNEEALGSKLLGVDILSQ
jgi:hypothetical protein